MKKFLSIIIFLVLINPAYNQEKHHKWQRFSGNWNISDSNASELNGWTLVWNYYELLDYNTIITLQPLINFNSIDVSAAINKRVKSPSEFMISFAVTSESQSWFYHMYGFKFTGGLWGMDKVSFIYSDRLDKTKPFDAKNNFFVKELASADCKIKHDKIYNFHIAFEGENVVLFINDEKILSAPFPDKKYDGRIAVSARNVKIAVDKVTAKQNDKLIFEDDFNEDSIFVKVIKVKKVPDNTNDKVQEKNKP